VKFRSSNYRIVCSGAVDIGSSLLAWFCLWLLIFDISSCHWLQIRLDAWWSPLYALQWYASALQACALYGPVHFLHTVGFWHLASLWSYRWQFRHLCGLPQCWYSDEKATSPRIWTIFRWSSLDALLSLARYMTIDL
jgi:hypothetical protein